ncbi:hypothetical protein PsYK624_142640 [Phanerochaete sordida]|uniref:Uncharacterized protein n=1 Tax=Phanerochaete sordida TaxID=48140 RepID=A0A9P3GMD9_9APHY|nr:hypothetical protein PsYK624_142640 [Phanerochaete sordida]
MAAVPHYSTRTSSTYDGRSVPSKPHAEELDVNADESALVCRARRQLTAARAEARAPVAHVRIGARTARLRSETRTSWRLAAVY